VELGRADGPPRWLGFVPVERSCACCGRVFIAYTMNMRYCGAVCRQRTDSPAEKALLLKLKYQGSHPGLRRVWDARVASGTVECRRCGELIAPGEPWDLGHVDGTLAHSGPEHRACNRRTATHRAARERRQW
jgi:hypothetical protein